MYVGVIKVELLFDDTIPSHRKKCSILMWFSFPFPTKDTIQFLVVRPTQTTTTVL